MVSQGRRGVVPPLASARIIDLQAARLAVANDGGRTAPPHLGEVPLAFREWRHELQQRSPGLGARAWIAALATHAVLAAAILLYASLTILPEPPPTLAVTLSFEAPKPSLEPAAASPVETPAVTAPPVAPDPPVEAELEPSEPEPTEPIVAAAEPSSPLPDPPPETTEAAMVETLDPVREPPGANAPEPVAVAPPRPRTPPHRPARLHAARHNRAPPAIAQHAERAPVGPPAAGPLGDAPEAASPPAAEQRPAPPLIPPTAASDAAGRRKPDYPPAARQRHLEGRVVLHVSVSPRGTATMVLIASSSGHPVLDQAALDAVQAWRFNPATRGGVAVAGAIDETILFRFEE
jgi:protein TonB